MICRVVLRGWVVIIGSRYYFILIYVLIIVFRIGRESLGIMDSRGEILSYLEIKNFLGFLNVFILKIKL